MPRYFVLLLILCTNAMGDVHIARFGITVDENMHVMPDSTNIRVRDFIGGRLLKIDGIRAKADTIQSLCDHAPPVSTMTFAPLPPTFTNESVLAIPQVQFGTRTEDDDTLLIQPCGMLLAKDKGRWRLADFTEQREIETHTVYLLSKFPIIAVNGQSINTRPGALQYNPGPVMTFTVLTKSRKKESLELATIQTARKTERMPAAHPVVGASGTWPMCRARIELFTEDGAFCNAKTLLGEKLWRGSFILRNCPQAQAVGQELDLDDFALTVTGVTDETKVAVLEPR